MWGEQGGKQYNRTAYLVRAGGEKEKFKFLYSNEVPTTIDNDETISHLEVQKENIVIETVSPLEFDGDSMIQIDGVRYNVESYDATISPKANGRFRKSNLKIKHLTIARRI